ncbi:ALK and LTK ligand 1 isoform X5 [Sparus aurata]|uniref:ALK and LTK ligand 1 isoform X5 n=1 Tax=Sparus aurata TaxID=8175 RepID=UPI0011C0EE78|nr:uncharacterized protein LOC115590863 isoform X5 [Sparus aurata]
MLLALNKLARCGSVRAESNRMAAPGGAFSAALRRSQDLDIGEQTHRHADRLQKMCKIANTISNESTLHAIIDTACPKIKEEGSMCCQGSAFKSTAVI